MATLPPLPQLRLPQQQPIQQQESPLQQYAQLQQLANMRAEAPLRERALQQQVQAGELGLQQQQQQAMDDKAWRTLTANPANKGKTYGELADILVQSGNASPAAYQQLKKFDVEQRQTLANLTKDQLANATAQHAQMQQLHDNVMAMPDAVLAEYWPAVVQAYDAIPGEKLLKLNPNQPLTKDQLQHAAPFLSMQNAYLDQEIARREKRAQAGKAEAELKKEQAQAAWYTENGGAPGVPVEATQQADWLKKNPGKGPSDYVMWKAQHSPGVIVQNMAQGSARPNGEPMDWSRVAQRYGMTQAAFDQQAQKYAQTGQLPPTGRGGNAMALNRDLMNRAAELHPSGSLAANSAEYKANAESLKKLQTSFDAVSAFEQTALKNMDVLQRTAGEIGFWQGGTAARFANIPMRLISSSMIGTDKMAAFKTALNTAQTEVAKVLNSSNASGVLSDSARHELQEIIDGNASYSAMVSSLNTLRQDMKNRHDSYLQQIDDIRGRLGGASAGNTGSSPNGQPHNDDPFAQFGGRKH